MTPQQEAVFEAKAEKMLAGHRELPSGRDFRAFYGRFRSDVNNPVFDNKFDAVFTKAPGSRTRLDKDYCPKCDKRKAWCVCKRH